MSTLSAKKWDLSGMYHNTILVALQGLCGIEKMWESSDTLISKMPATARTCWEIHMQNAKDAGEMTLE